MKLPLLVYGNPRLAKCPRIMLQKGEWKIEADNIDSELVCLDSRSSNVVRDGTILNIEYDDVVQLIIEKPGSEPHLSVYAVRLE